MYNTIINPLRKALMLSTNEYIILDAIYHLSNNVKYGGWAIISKQKLAEEYDLTRRTIINIVKTLELKGLVIRDERTNFLRASEIYCDAIQNKDKWIIASTSEQPFISGKVQDVKNLHTGSEKISQEGVKNFHSGCEIISHNNNNNNNKDNNKDNDTMPADLNSKQAVKKNKPMQLTIPTIEQVEKFFADNGYSRMAGVKAWNYYNDGNWTDSSGKKVINWKQKMRMIWFRDEHKQQSNNKMVY